LVIRETARMLVPSTRAANTFARSSLFSLFILNSMLEITPFVNINYQPSHGVLVVSMIHCSTVVATIDTLGAEWMQKNVSD
jgi:hypothetical protein